MKNAFKSAMWTWFWSALVGAGSAVLGWLNGAMSWATDVANGGDQTVHFPDPSVLVGTLFGLVFGAMAAAVVFLVRWAQNSGALPGESPSFDKTNKP